MAKPFVPGTPLEEQAYAGKYQAVVDLLRTLDASGRQALGGVAARLVKISQAARYAHDVDRFRTGPWNMLDDETKIERLQATPYPGNDFAVRIADPDYSVAVTSLCIKDARQKAECPAKRRSGRPRDELTHLLHLDPRVRANRVQGLSIRGGLLILEWRGAHSPFAQERTGLVQRFLATQRETELMLVTVCPALPLVVI